jgi:D-alanyl-D-alanine carboxypeptidase (penicillin-binding protein 5/6)
MKQLINNSYQKIINKNFRTYLLSFLTPYFAILLLFFSKNFLKYFRYSKKFFEKIAKNMTKSVIKKDSKQVLTAKIIKALAQLNVPVLFFGLFFGLFFSSSSFAAPCPDIITCQTNNYSALMIEEKSGNVLFDDQSDKIIYPASLTKLMTIYLTFEALKEGKLKMNQVLTVSNRAEAASNVNKTNTLHLKAGDEITVKQAIEGSIVKSYNELTVMLAEKIAGDEWNFARKMNFKARELQMNFSNFRNASGLDNVGHFTTAEDLSRLVLALQKDFPEHYHFFSLKEFSYNNEKHKTTNNVLLNYKYALGMKTGFTNKAGYNLITTANYKGYQIASIITGCESAKKRDDLTEKLLDQAFETR